MKRFCILLATIILLFAGCGMRASLTSQLLTDNDWPKKRVMVMPATDLTGIDLHESIDIINKALTKILRKTGFFNLYPHNKTIKFHPFTPGESIDPELLREAKERGMNAIIFETLNPIELNPGKSGIWPFRKKAWSCTVSMNVDIVDVNMGTILLNKEIADNITLSDEETTEETEKVAIQKQKKGSQGTPSGYPQGSSKCCQSFTESETLDRQNSFAKYKRDYYQCRQRRRAKARGCA